MAAGYMLVWTLFSVGAALLQCALGASLLSPMMTVVNPWLTIALLTVAGMYQLTPVKRGCFEMCRSPIFFVTTHMRPGATGAFRIGVENGIHCVGGCWALMLLLFAGGVLGARAHARRRRFEIKSGFDRSGT